MADSDYEYMDDNGSDDEYVGSKGSSGTTSRAQSQISAKRKTQEKSKRQAWQTERSLVAASREQERVVGEGSEDLEGADGDIRQSVQEREEERKRKR